MLNNIYSSTLYKNILPNPDFRAHFGTEIFVPKSSFQNALFIQLSPQIHHKIILNSYLMRLSIVLWFVMVSEQFEQIFQNMLFLRGNFRAIPLRVWKFYFLLNLFFKKSRITPTSSELISTSFCRILLRFLSYPHCLNFLEKMLKG